MRGQRFFLGRPPLAPLARAASALALLVDCPPSLPSATAASFLRGTALPTLTHGHGVIGLILGLAFFGIAAVARAIVSEVQTVDAGLPCGQCFTASALVCDLVWAEPFGCHGSIKPNRLGFVNPVEIGQKWAVL